MSTRTRLLALLALLNILGFMFGAVSCTGPASDKYTATTGITPGQTALLAGKWWLDYEQAKAVHAVPFTSAKQVSNPQP